MGAFCIPSIQAKALMVPYVGGNNFGIIPPNCMVGLASILEGNSRNMDFWQATKSRALSLLYTHFAHRRTKSVM